jgi:hypothetical protein
MNCHLNGLHVHPAHTHRPQIITHRSLEGYSVASGLTTGRTHNRPNAHKPEPSANTMTSRPIARITTVHHKAVPCPATSPSAPSDPPALGRAPCELSACVGCNPPYIARSTRHTHPLPASPAAVLTT